jgi:hypothetical protein
MIKKFAVQPSALSRWEDFRYVMEKLSFAQGRVLVRFPRSWSRSLLDSLDVGDVERMRYVERLRKYKEDRMISSGIAYDSALDWASNAERSGRSAFDRIIVHEGSSKTTNGLAVAPVAEVDEDFFETAREIHCMNSAENLARAASVFLQETTEATIVDPYFHVATPDCLNVLCRFAELALDTGKCKTFFVYTKSDCCPKDRGSSARYNFEKHFFHRSLIGFRVIFYFLDGVSPGQSFHARYLLTSKGGLRYDRGFRSASERNQQLVDISIIDKDLHGKLQSLYQDVDHAFLIGDSVEWIF